MGDMTMEAQSVIWLEMSFDRRIRCRLVKEWFKIDSYVNSIENLMLDIYKRLNRLQH